ncbi:MAG: helix-turn-helix domain-containing protein, partial [Planktomarina sp.]|nr:helix-turn-helix domain-containing protein [Planktomarina sp.]MDS9946587.1 helix-turn-helix domain-containing protein [Planktomarina sp.]MDS9951004.1 helix-turn-helix domain-containing protein [Planktomarina sp.]|tara:strand:- start:2065 stop:3036 length:972 start_codon:yes stop_codon:yes gene_type:complete
MKNAKNIWKKSNKTLKVGVLVLEQSNTLSLAAAVDPMRACNRRAAKVLFSWEFLTDQGQNISLTSGLSLKGQDARNFSGEVLILVAGFDLEKVTTSILIATLRRVASYGTCIIGVDGGSWVMAHAGLLDNHIATCHWEDLEKFARRFPAVNLVPDRYSICGPFVTTGGASPCIDLMLHLISVRHGRALSERVAAAFIYDPVHAGEAPQQMIATKHISVRHPRIARILKQMENLIESPPSIKALAKANGISLRKLEMEFKVATGRAPGAYFLDLRLSEARRLAIDSAQSVQEISLACGFSSQASFAHAFRNAFEQSVTALRRQH